MTEIKRTSPPSDAADAKAPKPEEIMKNKTDEAAKSTGTGTLDAGGPAASATAPRNPVTGTVTAQSTEPVLERIGQMPKPEEKDVSEGSLVMKPVHRSSPGYYYDRDQGAHMRYPNDDGKPAEPLRGEALFEASKEAEREALSRPPLLSKGPDSVTEAFAARAGDTMVKGVAENLTIAEEDAALLKERQPEVDRPPSSARQGAASTEDLR